MATEKEFYELIGRAIADGEFRGQMKEDPQAAAASVGVELSPEQEEQLRRADLGTLATELEQRASKFCSPMIG